MFAQTWRRTVIRICIAHDDFSISYHFESQNENSENENQRNRDRISETQDVKGSKVTKATKMVTGYELVRDKLESVKICSVV